MAETIESGGISHVSSNATMPRTSNGSNTRHPLGLLMTHRATLPQTASPTIITRGINFGARTAEQTRMFASNISSAIEGIEPLIEQARLRSSVSLGSLLNIQRAQTQTRMPATSSENTIARVPPDSYIINLEDYSASDPTLHDESVQDHHHHTMTITNNPLNIILQPDDDTSRNQSNAINATAATNTATTSGSNDISNNNNNNNTDENSTDASQIRPEAAAAVLKVYKRFIPFILILIAKGLYDHRVVLLNLVVILFTFDYANTVLKREVAKQQNKSWMSLLITVWYVIACIIFIDFEFDIDMFSSYTHPLTIGDLLWSVFVTDCVLKLITIVIKIAFTCLPTRLVEIRKRAKYYFMVEATSQLYRAIMPVRPWLYYLLEAYQGTEKVVGILLFVMYTISKGNDLLSNVKLFHRAVRKLFQDVSIGVSPSKEQIVESGGTCAICHEEYSVPVQLKCTHIFCETCVLTWLNRERSCPLCRAAITDHPCYGDGQTTNFVQFY